MNWCGTAASGPQDLSGAQTANCNLGGMPRGLEGRVCHHPTAQIAQLTDEFQRLEAASQSAAPPTSVQVLKNRDNLTWAGVGANYGTRVTSSPFVLLMWPAKDWVRNVQKV